MLEEMSSIIHSTTNDSWILEKILVRAIGRKASTEGNGTIFGMGQISYAFQILGNYFVENELFMLLHITGPKRSAADLIIFRGGSKGPISPFDSGAFVSLLNKGAGIDILRVLLNHKVYKLYKMYRLTLNSRNITTILYQIYLRRKVSIDPKLSLINFKPFH
jgi:hypothetical protein